MVSVEILTKMDVHNLPSFIRDYIVGKRLYKKIEKIVIIDN